MIQLGVWIQTDDSQWRKQISESEYRLIEVREYGEGYVPVEATVDLNSYTDDEIIEIMESYYSSWQNFYDSYEEDDRDEIIAECIFEQIETAELSICRIEGKEFKTEDEACNYAEALTELEGEN